MKSRLNIAGPRPKEMKLNTMGTLAQVEASRLAPSTAIALPPRHVMAARPVLVREPRAFPEASTSPALPTTIRDEMVEFYAFMSCQGGFRQVGMIFEQFLLVAAAPQTGRPACDPRGNADADV
jgi:hypothetical protein